MKKSFFTKEMNDQKPSHDRTFKGTMPKDKKGKHFIACRGLSCAHLVRERGQPTVAGGLRGQDGADAIDPLDRVAVRVLSCRNPRRTGQVRLAQAWASNS